MLPDNHVKEYLHEAYVRAVVAQAGYECSFSEQDYGIDARVSEVVQLKGKYVSSGFDFKIQMKASQDFRLDTTETVYSLKAEAHDRMALHTGSTIILVLFCVPQDANLRLEVTEDHLKLQQCCYWWPRPAAKTDKSSSIAIRIPRQNLFTPQACRDIMALVRAGMM